MKAVIDSVILIDYLNGVEQSETELSLYSEKVISIISWIEILAGAKSSEEENTIKFFLDNFRIVFLNRNIAELALRIRKKYKIKLPDAVIWATAQDEKTLLVTRSHKDYPVDSPQIRIPYNR